MAVKDWSTTASSNATADADEGINFAEGQAPGSLNDSMRSLMAVLKGDFANSLAASGYQKFPNGFILQWGNIPGTGADGNATFNIPFPNACVYVGTNMAGASSTTLLSCGTENYQTSGFTYRPRFVVNGGVVGIAGSSIRWFAFGY